MAITVVGANHRTAPIEVRERLHVPVPRIDETLGELHEESGVQECVLLSTCNRTELYLYADSPGGGRSAAERVLARHGGFTRSETLPHLYDHQGRDAVLHLYRVVSGLDSLVMGEAQIQGQVTEAYEIASDRLPEGVGPVLHRLFQSALSAGGRVRSETRVNEGAASVPSAAVRLVRKVFGELEGLRAMVVGAGEMGKLTLASLLEQGVSDALVASRTVERAEEAARGIGARAIAFDDFWEALSGVEIIVTSTSAPHTLVTRERLSDVLRMRRDPLVVVDIALPRDVEPSAGELPAVFLYNIDDLQRVVETTESLRASEREAAESLLEAEVDDFWEWYRGREAVPVIRGIRERAERIREEQVAEALEGIDGLSRKDRERIHQASRLVLKKILHAPTVGLRRLAVDDEGAEYLELARRLFGLDAGGGSSGRPEEVGDGEEPEVTGPDVGEGASPEADDGASPGSGARAKAEDGRT